MDPKLLAAIIAVLMGLASVLGAVATYIKSRSEVGGIKADREKTKLSRDREAEDLRVRISVLEKQDEFMSARLDKGGERPSMCRQQLFMRKDNVRFLKWLEANYERQTA